MAFPAYRRSHRSTNGRAIALFASDPLGAGNTKLIANLGVTPILFYDVRQNLTVAGGTASSLADVSGKGTYGAALAQATQAKQPTWNGTVLSFDGVTDFLLSTAAIPGLDLSGPLTMAVVMDSTAPANKAVVCVGQADGTGQNWTPGSGTSTTPVHFTTLQSGNAAGPDSGVALGGGLRLVLAYLNAATPATTIEVPSQALVSDATPGVALTAGNKSFSLGATAIGGAIGALTFRAALCFAGNYTAAQRDALKTWATTYHAAVLA